MHAQRGSSEAESEGSFSHWNPGQALVAGLLWAQLAAHLCLPAQCASQEHQKRRRCTVWYAVPASWREGDCQFTGQDGAHPALSELSGSARTEVEGEPVSLHACQVPGAAAGQAWLRPACKTHSRALHSLCRVLKTRTKLLLHCSSDHSAPLDTRIRSSVN